MYYLTNCSIAEIDVGMILYVFDPPRYMVKLYINIEIDLYMLPLHVILNSTINLWLFVASARIPGPSLSFDAFLG